ALFLYTTLSRAAFRVMQNQFGVEFEQAAAESSQAGCSRRLLANEHFAAQAPTLEVLIWNLGHGQVNLGAQRSGSFIVEAPLIHVAYDPDDLRVWDFVRISRI